MGSAQSTDEAAAPALKVDDGYFGVRVSSMALQPLPSCLNTLTAGHRQWTRFRPFLFPRPGGHASRPRGHVPQGPHGRRRRVPGADPSHGLAAVRGGQPEDRAEYRRGR